MWWIFNRQNVDDEFLPWSQVTAHKEFSGLFFHCENPPEWYNSFETTVKMDICRQIVWSTEYFKSVITELVHIIGLKCWKSFPIENKSTLWRQLIIISTMHIMLLSTELCYSIEIDHIVNCCTKQFSSKRFVRVSCKKKHQQP